MRSRLGVGLLVAACVGYTWLGLDRARAFAVQGTALDTAVAVAIVLLVGLSLALVAGEIRFGRTMAQMAAILEAEAKLLPDDLPVSPSGRIEKAAADARFEAMKAEVEAEPESWRAWYRVAIAYDDARDRKRARSAMRTAERIFRSGDRA